MLLALVLLRHLYSDATTLPQRAWLRKGRLPAAVFVVLASYLFVGACGSPDAPRIPWSVGFACSALAKQSESVEVTISYGDCTALGALVYGATVRRGGMGAASAPEDLPAGTYAFYATAYDAAGAVTTETCRDVELPSEQAVELVLGSQVVCGFESDSDGGGRAGGSVSPRGGRSESWVETRLPYASGAATSAVLSDGLHYLGGSESFTASKHYSKHYVYDATTGKWSDSHAPVPDSDTWGARAHTYQDRLYLLGGYPAGTRFRVYDPQTNAWSSLPTPPVALEWGFASGMIDGVLYAFGGDPGPATEADGCAYDVATGTWRVVASIPENHGRGALSSATVGSRIYVLNGNKGGGTTLLQIYDSATDRWSRGADLPGHEFEAASAAVEGTKIYFFGGASDQDIADSSKSPAGVSNAVNIFDSVTGQWSKGASMVTPSMWSTAQVYDGKFHVLGGFDAQSKQLDRHAASVD